MKDPGNKIDMDETTAQVEKPILLIFAHRLTLARKKDKNPVVSFCHWKKKGSKLTWIYFILRSVIPRRRELIMIIKSVERFSSSFSADNVAIKYSENSAKPETEFAPNRGEIG